MKCLIEHASYFRTMPLNSPEAFNYSPSPSFVSRFPISFIFTRQFHPKNAWWDQRNQKCFFPAQHGHTEKIPPLTIQEFINEWGGRSSCGDVI
jgi:hypothetical protein